MISGIPGTGGKRTAEEQNGLYKLGKSKADGYKRKSYHQSGNAFDIYGYVNGKATWDKEILTAIAEHIKAVALKNYGVKIYMGW